MAGKKVVRRGQVHSSIYAQAVDKLQKAGFATELYVNRSNVVLRWVKGGAKWHITADHKDSMTFVFDELGANALSWLRARNSGDEDESDHATCEK